MAMRRGAFAPGNEAESAKLRRLLDLADEAPADGRKVVVSSFFRDVLGIVAAALGEKESGGGWRKKKKVGRDQGAGIPRPRPSAKPGPR